jgi:hypothetical protein
MLRFMRFKDSLFFGTKLVGFNLCLDNSHINSQGACKFWLMHFSNWGQISIFNIYLRCQKLYLDQA